MLRLHISNTICSPFYFLSSWPIGRVLSYLISQQLPWGRNPYHPDPLRPQRAAFWTQQTPGHDWGHSHGPTPGGWSPHWQGCLVPTARSAGAGRVRGRGWRKAGGKARRPQRCHASGGRRELRSHPAPAPGQRGHAHHLGARNVVKPTPLPQQSGDALTTSCSAFHPVSVFGSSGPYSYLRGLIYNFLSANK